MLPVCVIIPVHTLHLGLRPHLLDPMLCHLRGKVHVFVAVNGPAHLGINLDFGPDIYGRHVSLEGNPYIARNAALRMCIEAKAHRWRDIQAFFLTDSDCRPECDIPKVLEQLLLLPQDIMVAGRITTLVPTGTRHFNALQGLECYEGHQEPNTTSGACMYFTRGVCGKIGPMKEDSVSRGDDEYAVRWRAAGGEFMQHPPLHVQKWIHGMSLQGICEKQLRRGRSACRALRPSEPATLADLDDAMEAARLHLRALRATGSAHDYKNFVDHLFRVQYNLGVLQQYYDIPEEP